MFAEPAEEVVWSRIPALRFHDLRHHAITELAESQASDATIMAIAGHVSRQMLEHYSHVRLNLKRKALEGLATRRGNLEGNAAGYDTNHDTIQASDAGRTNVTCWKQWSGREDLNLRPPGPEPRAGQIQVLHSVSLRY